MQYHQIVAPIDRKQSMHHDARALAWSGVSNSDGLPFFRWMYALDVPEDVCRKASTCLRREVEAMLRPYAQLLRLLIAT